MKTTIKEIKGDYWWGDNSEVIDTLISEVTAAIKSRRVFVIDIGGTDFNDGREQRNFKISVDAYNGKVTITTTDTSSL